MKYSRAFIVAALIAVLLGSTVVLASRADETAKRLAGPQVERVVAADPQAAISICLASGEIKVRGWDLNQVRARSSDFAEIEFKRPATARDSDPAKEITVLLARAVTAHSGSCQASGDIELDVPRGASVRLQSRDGDIQVVNVAKVSANAVGGNVNLEGVTQAAEVNTIGGAILLRNSSGSVSLHSIGGRIEARGVRPAAVGDACKASTVGGDITLDRAGYSELSASSINGAVNISGPLVRGGRYHFNTISGDLNLALPADSSFRLEAKLSRSVQLVTDFPLKTGAETVEQPAQSRQSGSRKQRNGLSGPDPYGATGYGWQRINAVSGTGDALITLSSFSGAIYLRKK